MTADWITAAQDRITEHNEAVRKYRPYLLASMALNGLLLAVLILGALAIRLCR